jgi:ATP-dependent RNA helicase DDX1
VCLAQVIERLQMAQCLIFCRTNLDCDQLEAFLNAAGGGKAFRGKAEKGIENEYSCVVLAGQRSMEERRRNLAAFKEGDVRLLICTDVAARGLDIKELPYVVNMTLPDKEEDYVHRVGRVGRAEVMGLAISIVSTTELEKVWYYDKRKWEGKTLSTKLATEGGCCIWYDEPALFKGVQRRLSTTIETLDDFLTRQPGGLAALAAYGQAKDGGLNEASTAHLAQLAPAVAELARLETSAQLSFLLGMRTSAKRPLAAANSAADVEMEETQGGASAVSETAMDVEATAAAESTQGHAQGSSRGRHHGGRGPRRGHQRGKAGRGIQ